MLRDLGVEMAAPFVVGVVFSSYLSIAVADSIVTRRLIPYPKTSHDALRSEAYRSVRWLFY